MSFDNFSHKQNGDMDPNYIYPTPYIDPMMYVNPYYNQLQMDYGNSGYYMTYMNPYINYPMMDNQYAMLDDDFYFDDMDSVYMNQGMNMMPQMMNNMSMMPQMMGSMPMMPQMMGGINMMPNMMMPMMPGMMHNPCMMMSMMPQINMEEFDEEEM